MQTDLLRPREGWRAFAGEVGVIVLGVLLALGAQQAVESWQVREDVAAFRETIDREVAYNLYALDMRDRQVPCDQRKLAEVEQWLERSRSGRSMPPLYPYAAHTSAFSKLAKETGIRPIFPSDHRREDIAAAMHCRSLLEAPKP